MEILDTSTQDFSSRAKTLIEDKVAFQFVVRGADAHELAAYIIDGNLEYAPGLVTNRRIRPVFMVHLFAQGNASRVRFAITDAGVVGTILGLVSDSTRSVDGYTEP